MALSGGHVPDWFSLGHHHRQPQDQPGLAHLGGARQDMQPLGEQAVHHKVWRAQGLAHQGSPIDRIEFHVISASLSAVLSVGFIPRLCQNTEEKGVAKSTSDLCHLGTSSL